MISYTWKINQLDKQTSDGFVITAHYTVVAVDEAFSASSYGTTSWTQKSEDFVPYDQLTEELVLGWVYEFVNKEVVETSLASQIEALKNPPITSGILPWLVEPTVTEPDPVEPNVIDPII